MLKAWQAGVMALLGAAMWAFVTWRIGGRPVPGNSQALVGYLFSPLAGALSVWLCKVAGRLSPDQIVPGVMVVGAAAMMLDGAAIRFAPELYRSSARGLMLTGADLLWTYGVSFLVAVAWAAWAQRRAARRLAHVPAPI